MITGGSKICIIHHKTKANKVAPHGKFMTSPFDFSTPISSGDPLLESIYILPFKSHKGLFSLALFRLVLLFVELWRNSTSA
jgi:hypothetical protein